MTIAETQGDPVAGARRVYPLDARDLTEEQIAVAFAMTSRRPEPFDEIAQQVSQEKAADFHERWVLGYGHASVAEHAVVHLAVENVSRLACDGLEDNRLASYTEKSSRYQVIPPGDFYFPRELDAEPELGSRYNEACRRLFDTYRGIIDGCIDHLRRAHPQRERERESAYNLRLRRIATDSCRALLPASTLTNVGVTANARVLEHAVSKLMSSELDEERELGLEMRLQGRNIAPTLIKYADRNPYLAGMPGAQREMSGRHLSGVAGGPSGDMGAPDGSPAASTWHVKLVDWDRRAEEKLAAALLYRYSGLAFDQVQRKVELMSPESRLEIIDRSFAGLGDHDAPAREAELVDYTFEVVLDYGAYRELKRHRMMSHLPQPLTVGLGYHVPDLVIEAALRDRFEEAVELSDSAFQAVQDISPWTAQYLVTHAHYRRLLCKMNLRECYHLFKLRTSDLAHYAVRAPMLDAMKLAVDVHPGLFRHLRLREYPQWWPFQRPD